MHKTLLCVLLLSPAKPLSSRGLLLQKVDDVGDVVRHWAVNEDVAVVVAEGVSAGWRGEIAVDVGRKPFEVANVEPWEIAADDYAGALRRVDAREFRCVVLVQIDWVCGPEVVGRALRGDLSPMGWLYRRVWLRVRGLEHPRDGRALLRRRLRRLCGQRRECEDAEDGCAQCERQRWHGSSNGFPNHYAA